MRPRFPDLLVGGLLAASGLTILACGGPAGPTPTTSPGLASPSPTATTITTAPPSGAAATYVVLAVATRNAVTIAVTDASATLLDASSGTPGDGASVPPFEVHVVNDDPTTIRLTWSGGPCDATDSLSIDADVRRFLLVEPECPGDSVAYDRILVLRFSEPIDAAGVEARLQDGLDTAS
jgi:hypothetical protein